MDNSNNITNGNAMPVSKILNTEAILSARKDEIICFEQAIASSNKKTSISQRLPTHMRRRAMCHSAKRMPRYLRDAYQKQLEKNKAGKKQSKCPRRKFRRRPNNLLTEYNRRQNKFVWLETHIWHAKRFKMVSKWGYKLAENAYSKVFRASYRAFSYHCLVQDISYHCCIEVKGPLSTLLNGFKTISSSECGLTMAAKCWLKGTRQGSVVLFHKDAYPYKVIGNVDFIWKPPSLELTGKRTVWIWCHPAFYSELVNVLIELFALKPWQTSKIDTVATNKSTDANKDEEEETKLSTKNVPFIRTPKYVNTELDIYMALLKDTLNRFRLTGPLSNAVLAKAFNEPLKFSDDININDDDDDNKERRLIRTKQTDVVKWWTTLTNNNNEFQNYINLLDDINSPTQFPPYTVIGCYIADPRLHLPSKRTKAVPKNGGSCFLATPNEQWCLSEIWNPEVRDMCTKCKLTTCLLNQLRSDLLVGGHDHHLSNHVKSVLPVLLIQRPGSSLDSRLGLGSGWDIIFPAGWGMPVWMALILNGARPGALRETRTINFEAKTMQFPPDSKAGKAHYKCVEETSRDRYFKLPPNKRPNYIKLGFPTPFSYPWNRLLGDWVDRDDKAKEEKCDEKYRFFVLRNKRYIHWLVDDLQNLKYKRTNYLNIPDDYYYYHHRNKNDDDDDKSKRSCCLLSVIVKVTNTGKLEPFSHIYLPTRDDLKALSSVSSLPVEKARVDKNKSVRKSCRMEHRALLKYLRRKRIEKKKQERNKLDENSLQANVKKIKKTESPPTADFIEEYRIRMRNLWLPSLDDDSIESIRYHCDREIIGFIVCSTFSFVESCTVGQGYIVLSAFPSLLKLYHSSASFEPTVLIRSPTTLTYRYGKISISLT